MTLSVNQLILSGQISAGQLPIFAIIQTFELVEEDHRLRQVQPMGRVSYYNQFDNQNLDWYTLASGQIIDENLYYS